MIASTRREMLRRVALGVAASAVVACGAPDQRTTPTTAATALPTAAAKQPAAQPKSGGTLEGRPVPLGASLWDGLEFLNIADREVIDSPDGTRRVGGTGPFVFEEPFVFEDSA
jgi:hypothetical protein